eukprot:m51a1_g2033 putative neutrophil cytosol factor 1 (102) ;mRNA; f:1334533-1334838
MEIVKSLMRSPSPRMPSILHSPRKKRAASDAALPAVGTVCCATWDYSPETDVELELRKGDAVVVVQKSESGWWYAMKGNKGGYVPGSYLRQLRPGSLPNSP